MEEDRPRASPVAPPPLQADPAAEAAQPAVDPFAQCQVDPFAEGRPEPSPAAGAETDWLAMPVDQVAYRPAQWVEYVDAAPHHLSVLPSLELAATSSDESDRLFHKFRAFPRRSGEAADDHLVRFVSHSLQTASPGSVLGYRARLLRELQRRGCRGYRTMKIQATKRAVKRFAAMVKPRQAMTVAPRQVHDAVRALMTWGYRREAAMVAVAWMLRSRLSDAKYLVTSDVKEVLNPGGPPSRVGAEVLLREKLTLEWKPPTYLPPGHISGVFVEWVRAVRRAGGRTLFNPEEYTLIKSRVRRALPPGAWVNSLRRSAVQAIEAAFGISVEEAGELLRHTHAVVDGAPPDLNEGAVRFEHRAPGGGGDPHAARPAGIRHREPVAQRVLLRGGRGREEQQQCRGGHKDGGHKIRMLCIWVHPLGDHSLCVHSLVKTLSLGL
eukprot:TRINITY_DN3642_c0_g1_i20.p2 TRINITY_DN3642_c0_g1~~TRINITY_DN3642_c0_g1_i20.p2  ORF type:complete len:438 (-),score=35.63 TRINITY_DN3642_c0_g1_i20:92-1405(-)